MVFRASVVFVLLGLREICVRQTQMSADPTLVCMALAQTWIMTTSVLVILAIQEETALSVQVAVEVFAIQIIADMALLALLSLVGTAAASVRLDMLVHSVISTSMSAFLHHAKMVVPVLIL